jgi:peptidoglycan/LPS O-acetylase OafA/YrhL
MYVCYDMPWYFTEEPSGSIAAIALAAGFFATVAMWRKWFLIAFILLAIGFAFAFGNFSCLYRWDPIWFSKMAAAAVIVGFLLGLIPGYWVRRRRGDAQPQQGERPRRQWSTAGKITVGATIFLALLFILYSLPPSPPVMGARSLAMNGLGFALLIFGVWHFLTRDVFIKKPQQKKKIRRYYEEET